MFLLALISFFVFAISGIQLVAGGYLLAGIPALAVSGVAPMLITSWQDKIRQKRQKSRSKSRSDCCDLDCCDLGCD
jgi:hypothetical protein